MFHESQYLGREIMMARIQNFPLRRFVAGETRSVNPDDLLAPIERTAGYITDTLPSGKRVIRVVRAHADEMRVIDERDVIELTHTHPVSRIAAFTHHITVGSGGIVHKGGDIVAMQEWAAKAPRTLEGVVGSYSTRIAPTGAAVSRIYK
jgi:hypothetical protein